MTSAEARNTIINSKDPSLSEIENLFPFIIEAAEITDRDYLAHKANFFDYLVDELKSKMSAARIKAHLRETRDVLFFANCASDMVKLYNSGEFGRVVDAHYRSVILTGPPTTAPATTAPTTTAPATTAPATTAPTTTAPATTAPATTAPTTTAPATTAPTTTAPATTAPATTAPALTPEETEVKTFLENIVTGKMYKESFANKYTLQHITIFPEFKTCVKKRNFGGYVKAGFYELAGFGRVFKKMWGHLTFGGNKYGLINRSFEIKEALDKATPDEMLKIVKHYKKSLLANDYALVDSIIHERANSFMKKFVEDARMKIVKEYQKVNKAYNTIKGLPHTITDEVKQRYLDAITGQANTIKTIMDTRREINDFLESASPDFSKEVDGIREAMDPICIGHDVSKTDQHYERMEDCIYEAINQGNDQLAFRTFTLAEQVYNSKKALSKDEIGRRRAYGDSSVIDRIATGTHEKWDKFTGNKTGKVFRKLHRKSQAKNIDHRYSNYDLYLKSMQNTDSAFVFDLTTELYSDDIDDLANDYFKETFILLARASKGPIADITALPDVSTLPDAEKNDIENRANDLVTNSEDIIAPKLEAFDEQMGIIASNYSRNGVDEAGAITAIQNYMNEEKNKLKEYLNQVIEFINGSPSELNALEAIINDLINNDFSQDILNDKIKNCIQIYSTFTNADSRSNAEMLIANMMATSGNMKLCQYMVVKMTQNMAAGRYDNGAVEAISR